MTATPLALSQSATDGREPRTAHLPAVGALRGIAALYVVAYHVMAIPKEHLAVGHGLLPFVAAGYSGVPLFFLISAFTLCHTMQGRSESRPILRFYARRAIRILPLYYFLLLVSVARKYLLVHSRVSMLALPLSVLVLFNLVPGKETGIVAASWTIGVEVLFYVLFPALFRWVTSLERALGLFVATLALSALFSLAVQALPYPQSTRDSFFDYSLVRSLPCFAVGMIVYWTYRALQPRGLPQIWAHALVAAAGLGFVVFAEERCENLVIPAVVYSMLTIGLLFSNLRLLVNRVTEWLGDISYSLYLWHPLVVVSLLPLYPRVYAHLPVTAAWAACFSVTLAVLIPLGYLSYRFIEQPTRRAGLRLLRQWA